MERHWNATVVQYAFVVCSFKPHSALKMETDAKKSIQIRTGKPPFGNQKLLGYEFHEVRWYGTENKPSRREKLNKREKALYKTSTEIA